MNISIIEKVPDELIEQILDVVATYGATGNVLNSIRDYLEEEMQMIGSDRLLFVCQQDCTLVGHGQLLLDEKKEGHIHGLQVRRNTQRKGIGTLLMERMEEYGRLKNLSRLTLSVDHDNDKAINFYRKIGYKIDSSSTGKRGTKIINMSKIL